MRARPALVSALLLAGCGQPHRAPLPLHSALAAESRPVLLAPATTRYRAVTRVRVEQDFDGRLQTTEMQWSFFLTTVIEAGAGSGLRATIILDSIEPDPSGTISQAERERVRGARFTGLLAPEGRLDGLTGPDSLLPSRLRQMASGLRQFFPRLPDGGAGAGRAWSDTTETTARTGDGDITIRARNAHQATHWTEFAGQRALEVEVTSTYTLAGAGAQFGQPFTLKGEGIRSARQYLTADGHYAGGVARDSAGITVTLTQMGITIPGRQWRTDSLTVAH